MQQQKINWFNFRFAANAKGVELLYLVLGRHSIVSLGLNGIYIAWNHRGDHEYNKETKCKTFFSDVVETL